MSELTMSADFHRKTNVSQTLPQLRAIITIVSGSREMADTLIEHALSGHIDLSPGYPEDHDLLSQVIQLASENEPIDRAAINGSAEPSLSLLHELPFSERLAFVLVEVAGFSPVAASRYCRRMPHEVVRSVCDTGRILSRHEDDHGRSVANDKSPEYEFPL